MKMKILMENWKKYSLKEEMKKPENLPASVFVLINTEDFPEMVVFSYVDKSGRQIPESSELPSGFVAIAKNDDFGGCLGAWVIDFTTAKKGWGPLLYDVAIEWASMRGRGVMPDRVAVSDKAYEVWVKYANDRPDVKSFQLDNLENELTPEEIDNCMQSSSNVHARKNNSEWHNSPLSKVYKKDNPEMIKKLDSLNKLIHRSDDLFEEKFHGGLADKKQESDFDPEALARGTAVEMEHTDDPEAAKEIAMDHLVEDPKYYDKLAKIEKTMRKDK